MAQVTEQGLWADGRRGRGWGVRSLGRLRTWGLYGRRSVGGGESPIWGVGGIFEDLGYCVGYKLMWLYNL
jgi:hypothetical protein